MENASKALIIAAAILLAILIISLGIFIFNQAQSTVNNNGMGEAEIQTFNNKFLKYEGTITGTQARAMIQELVATNVNAATKVSFQSTATGATLGATDCSTSIGGITKNIVTSKKFNVTLSYGSDGRINKVTLAN